MRIVARAPCKPLTSTNTLLPQQQCQFFHQRVAVRVHANPSHRPMYCCHISGVTFSMELPSSMLYFPGILAILQTDLLLPDISQLMVGLPPLISNNMQESKGMPNYRGLLQLRHVSSTKYIYISIWRLLFPSILLNYI